LTPGVGIGQNNPTRAVSVDLNAAPIAPKNVRLLRSSTTTSASTPQHWWTLFLGPLQRHCQTGRYCGCKVWGWKLPKLPSPQKQLQHSTSCSWDHWCVRTVYPVFELPHKETCWFLWWSQGVPVAQAAPVPGCGQRKRCQHPDLCSSLIWYCLFFIYVLVIYWPASLPVTCPVSMHRYCLPNPHSFGKFHCSLTCAVLPCTLVTTFLIAQPRWHSSLVWCSSFLETSEALLWFHFFGNKSRLSASKCFQWL